MVVLSLWLLIGQLEMPPTPVGQVQWTSVLPGAPARGCAVDERFVFQGVLRAASRKEHAWLVAVDRKNGRVA